MLCERTNEQSNVIARNDLSESNQTDKRPRREETTKRRYTKRRDHKEKRHKEKRPRREETTKRRDHKEKRVKVKSRYLISLSKFYVY